MPKTRRFFSMLSVLAIVILSCGLPTAVTPTSDPNAIFTAAAQTVEAQLTQAAPGDTPIPSPTEPPSATPLGTNTPLPTNTPVPSPTPICDKSAFVSETIEDGTDFAPGVAFTKIWRLKNAGVCKWTTAYALVFDSGNAMGASSPVHLMGDVLPGQTVEIAAPMTAPATAGTHTGYWKMRNAAGVLFAKVWVKIDVVAPTATSTVPAAVPVTTTLAYLPGESGLVTSGGGVNTLTVAAGDSASNQGVEAFMSFDISGVPAGSTIQSATLKLKGGSQVRSDPFATLGCLRAYVHNFGAVDPGDFVPPGALGAIARWCNTAELESAYADAGFTSAVQGAVGASRFQIRLQFKDTLTDGDGTIDDVLILAPVTLTVTYLAP